ncbi:MULTISPECIES: transposase [unclassified Streptomyces]|uniref:IS110 family transposase n=1 Tax=Streptomyces sp. NBC_00119 TaxID=2975659 RepID=A0AAU1UHV7_9ACTN|nr:MULTISPECIES: transposase [unclassified Streptomyces]MCX4647543.1 IS110 family transposase [Streptomyces sp. NBC_01446]MCX5320121.1 IS110 family transposase [Streptomyces sp. NBC_00120]
MVLLGVDPHKSTHTAAGVAADSQQQLSSVTIRASLPEYRRLLRWARQWPQRTWAVENANGLGRHLVQWLIARGERVIDVPATATSRVRELSRGGGRKNDQIDAAAAATVAHLHGREGGRHGRPMNHQSFMAGKGLEGSPAATELRHVRSRHSRPGTSQGHATFATALLFTVALGTLALRRRRVGCTGALVLRFVGVLAASSRPEHHPS